MNLVLVEVALDLLNTDLDSVLHLLHNLLTVESDGGLGPELLILLRVKLRLVRQDYLLGRDLRTHLAEQITGASHRSTHAHHTVERVLSG